MNFIRPIAVPICGNVPYSSRDVTKATRVTKTRELRLSQKGISSEENLIYSWLVANENHIVPY